MSDFLDGRTVYLHIPKTGGNWIRSIAKKSGKLVSRTHRNKHATYDLLVGSGLKSKRRFPGFQNRKADLRTFCVVRNPLLWYQSFFRYQTDNGWKQWGVTGDVDNWHCLSPLNMAPTDDFNAYMRTVNANAPGFLNYLYSSYALPSGARVLKNETLRDDLLALNSDWGLCLDERLILSEDKINVSTKIDIDWSEENYANTLRNEAPTFLKYGYAMGDESVVRVR